MTDGHPRSRSLGLVAGDGPDRPPVEVGRHRYQEWTELDEYDRASVAVDCVVLTVRDRHLELLVWLRDNEPALKQWALPGAYVNWKEDVSATVGRVLKQKAGIDFSASIYRVGAESYPERDERGWVVSFLHLGLAPASALDAVMNPAHSRTRLAVVEAAPGEVVDPKDLVVRIPESDQTALALGHNELVASVLAWLRERSKRTPIALDLLSETFTLREFQEATEAILGESLKKASFRRSVTLTRNWVEPTGNHRSVGAGRQVAELYRRAENI